MKVKTTASPTRELKKNVAVAWLNIHAVSDASKWWPGDWLTRLGSAWFTWYRSRVLQQDLKWDHNSSLPRSFQFKIYQASYNSTLYSGNLARYQELKKVQNVQPRLRNKSLKFRNVFTSFFQDGWKFIECWIATRFMFEISGKGRTIVLKFGTQNIKLYCMTLFKFVDRETMTNVLLV